MSVLHLLIVFKSSEVSSASAIFIRTVEQGLATDCRDVRHRFVQGGKVSSPSAKRKRCTSAPWRSQVVLKFCVALHVEGHPIASKSLRVEEVLAAIGVHELCVAGGDHARQ